MFAYPSSIGASLIPVTLKQRRQSFDNVVRSMETEAMMLAEAFREDVRKYPPEVGISAGGQLPSRFTSRANQSILRGRLAGTQVNRSFYVRTMTLFNAWKIEPQPTSAGNVTIRIFNDAIEPANPRGRGRPYAFFVHGSTAKYGTGFHRAHGWQQLRDVYQRYQRTSFKAFRSVRNMTFAMAEALDLNAI